MPQTINNENDYRLTRSKHQNGPHAPPAPPITDESIQVNTREYLGDLSNHTDKLSHSKGHPAAKRRPLGGDIQPLQQRNSATKVPTAGTAAAKSTASAANGAGADASAPVGGAHASKSSGASTAAGASGATGAGSGAAASGASNSAAAGSAATSNTSTSSSSVIPPRMPQKRQATESSTNLVEKLHISHGHHPHNNHLTTTTTSSSAYAAGAAAREAPGLAATHALNAPYKKSKLTDYEWEDLDEEDMDDPLMVSEYVNDIFPYLRELEIKSLPDAQYLFKQKHLKPKMRSILVDWLVEMHLRFRLLPETLFLAINIMDRFMSLEVVQIDKLQLLATGSLFIAAKYEEVFSPSVKNYAYFTDGSYTEDEILQAEKYMLKVLNYDLSYPNPMNFLRRISKADDYDVQSRTLGKYLLEISIIDYKFIGMLPSLCSASAMYIARAILAKSPVWNGNLIHYSGGYRVADMRDCIEKIIAFLVAPVEHDEFFKKYASRKFMKASILCRNWAKKVVQENRDIFELP